MFFNECWCDFLYIRACFAQRAEFMAQLPPRRRVAWGETEVREYRVVGESEGARALRHDAFAARRSSGMAAARLEGESWRRAKQREARLELFDLSPRADKLDSYIARYGSKIMGFNRLLAMGLATLQVNAQGPAWRPDCDTGVMEWQLIEEEALNACKDVDDDMVRDGSRDAATGVLTLRGVELPPYAGMYTEATRAGIRPDSAAEGGKCGTRA